MSSLENQESAKAKGRIGLVNLGNTCFLNSALQVIRNVGSLAAYFNSDDCVRRINPENKYSPMVIPIREFVNSIWREDLIDGTRISPRKFYHTLVDIADKVGYDDLAVKHRQADAGEALIFMLDCLHEGLAHPVEMAITGNPITPEEKRWFVSYEQWIKHYKRQWSSVVRFLHGQKMSATTCKACQYHSETFEPWSSLNIPCLQYAEQSRKETCLQQPPVEGNPSLTNCLQEYFKEEIIEDYHCDACGKKQPATHTIRLSILPENILLVLNRFTNQGKKVSTKVDFDIDSVDLDTWFIGNRETTGTKYRAIAVIDHFGSLGGGHYAASARDRTEDSKWFRYDDDNVAEMPKKYVNNEHTYVIMLERIRQKKKPSAIFALEA